MPDDVGGKPFQDGWEPDDDRGGADQDFASVVFDEDFVRAAAFHEPTAVERLLAAAQARAASTDTDGNADGAYGPAPACGCEGEYGDGDDRCRGHCQGPYGPHGGTLRPYRPSARWHRPVAWVLAVLLGVGMVALAFAAVYRGASGSRDDQVPAPATTGATGVTGRTGSDEPHATASAPSASAARTAPAPLPAAPHTP
ncbi:hypothetical protein AB0A69_00465 [Streptomyces sp. NPDC045431]|uniref:SCO2584 family spore wall biosynthesis protein n=1 Tax=Streptomyces sp. NPDC045431 TaxID=3155613 RepID=UPI003411C5C7